MSLISRYILKQYFAAMAVSLMAFVGIFYVVDLIQQLDKFIDREVTALLIAEYYLNFMPYIIVLTIPVSMLLACLFTFGQLAKYGELTAMKASGLSLYRLIRPMVLSSVCVSLGIFAAGEWIVPEANQRRADINNNDVDKQFKASRSIRNNVLYRGQDGRQYLLRLYNGLSQQATNVFIVEFREGSIVQTIHADEMQWTAGVWVLSRGTLRRFEPRGTLVGFRDFERLPRPEWKERPEDFQKEQKKPEAMNYGELQQYIRNVRRGGGDVQGYLVDLNLKIAFPCANIIIVMFGAALASHVKKSGAALGFAMSIGICFTYWGMLRISQAFGHAGSLSPDLAAWGPNLLFGAVALGLILRAPK